MTTPATAPLPRSAPRVHPFNALFGVAFLAAAGLWAIHDRDLLDGYDVGRAIAIGLIVLGTLGVVATLVVTRRSQKSRSFRPLDPTPSTSTEGDDDEQASDTQR